MQQHAACCLLLASAGSAWLGLELGLELGLVLVLRPCAEILAALPTPRAL
jgi:hypothetical protein